MCKTNMNGSRTFQQSEQPAAVRVPGRGPAGAEGHLPQRNVGPRGPGERTEHPAHAELRENRQ